MARALSGVRLVVFLLIAAVLAFVIAKALAFALHLFWVLTGYIFAFVLAVLLLGWLWSRFTKPKHETPARYDEERDEFGRRRY